MTDRHWDMRESRGEVVEGGDELTSLARELGRAALALAGLVAWSAVVILVAGPA